MEHSFDLVAVTGCTTGIAHTYMAKEALETAAANRSLSIRVETHGQVGVEHMLTQSEIDSSRGVVIAADKDVGLDRFSGKTMVATSISQALSLEGAGRLIDVVLDLEGSREVAQASPEPAGNGALSVSVAASHADDFVQPNQVFLGCSLSSKAEILSFISEQAVRLGFARDAAELKDAFEARENEGTTGMMEGFAIPHAKSSAVLCPSVLVVKSSTGASDWDTMDGLAVHIALALIVPARGAALKHLKLLSRIAEMLMDAQFRNILKESEDAAEIASTISGRLA